MRGRGRLILTIVGVLVLCLLAFFLFVSPQRSELAQVRTDVETAEAETLRLQAELRRRQGLQENAAQLEAQLSKIRELVPIKAEVPNFMFQVQDAANAAGLDFVQITPSLPQAPPEGAALAEVRMLIGAKGGYFSVQDFIRRLHALDRAVRLDNISLTGEVFEGAIRLTLNSNARVFFELPDPAPVAGAIGATPTPTPTPTP